MVPVRSAGEAFASASYRMTPDPPARDHVTRSHGSSEIALHSHDELPVTLTVPLPPFGGSAAVVEERVTEQRWPAWITLNLLVPISITPVRCSRALLAPTVYVRVASDDPVEGDVI